MGIPWSEDEPWNDFTMSDAEQFIGDHFLPYRKEARVAGMQEGYMTPVVTHPQTGEEIEGEPDLSLMQHIKNVLGLQNAEEVWATNPTAYKR
jgi:hypothetical protein